jgi:hypothetical protein
MIPAFLSPTVSPPAFEPSVAPISVMRKHAPGGDVILAVNRGAEPLDITFDIEGSDAQIEVLDEHRTVDLRSRRLTDHFDKYATHVYRLRADKR